MPLLRHFWTLLGASLLFYAIPSVYAQALPNANLTQNEAKTRKAAIQNVDYQLSIDLSGEGDKFQGESRVSFQMKKPQATFLDFHGGQVENLVINGKHLTQVNYDARRIPLPASFLKSGDNEVRVKYTRSYSRTGSGLYRFKDPEDGHTYLFTQFQPFDANQLFPSFDQPDLKASYTMDVIAPENWQVISASRENRIETLSDKRKRWYFPQTERFSTYIFSLHAGPYVKWEDQAGKIALRLFARQSLAQFVEPKDWFPVTKQGFEFFDRYFEFPYPFHKYDQIVVPDFNAGAMENVASVTFSERFIKRRAASYEERRSLANTILHELAHMWFGNLVTMEWWNDLWLNESFATFMAHLALVEATEFEDSWQSFLRSTKSWAYYTDQLDTTHPIEADIPDTLHAFSNFDGITYGKGASFLKLLRFYMGEEKFRAGLAHYFKNFAYQTTVREDFIQSLAHAYGRPLDSFANEWLQTAGVNQIQVTPVCENSQLKKLVIRQSAPKDQPTLRSHAANLALLAPGKEGVLQVSRVLNIRYQGAVTEIELKQSEACPELVYPNYQDQDYVIVDLSQDMPGWQKNLARIEDPFLRLMIWRDLWEAVIATRMTAFSFADLLIHHLPQEDDEHIQNLIMRALPGLKDYLRHAEKYQELKAEAKAKQQKLAELIWQKLGEQKTSDQLRISWLDSFLGFAGSKQQHDQLIALYAGKVKLPNFQLDQDMRWQILQTLASFGDKRSQSLLAKASKEDPSIRGKRNAIAAQVIQPNLQEKLKWIGSATAADSKMTVAERRIILSAMFPAHQEQLRLAYAEDFYKSFPQVMGNFPPNIAAGIVRALAPLSCSESELRRLQSFVKSQGQLSQAVGKTLRNLIQEDERCLNMMQRLLQSKV
ncbi:MAG: aminopeptidase N [Oligoflexus sp.]